MTGRGLRVLIDDVSYRFGAVVALDAITIDVRPGEFMTLLGPSGSGKTTVLRIIGGLLPCDEGRVLIGDRDVTEVRAEHRDIGFVFQNYALFPHLNVFENVAFPLRLRRLAEGDVRRRVEETLALVQMATMAGRQAAELSGGQQQRVALARAIVFRPTVLLMDEPLGALDKRLRQQVGLELRRLQRGLGITAIYVTHDQEEAFTMSDRIAVMSHGRVRQIASPEEIYRRPQDEFTATFVGELNRIEGTMAVADGVPAVRTPDGLVLRVPGRAGVVAGEVLVGVRPERIQVNPDLACENRFRASVRTVVFLGSFYRAELALEGGRVLVADLRDGADRVSEGETVDVGWRAEDGLVYPGGC